MFNFDINNYNVEFKIVFERLIMKILVATKNQGKIEGARRALARYFDDFEIEGIPASSDVADQPVNGDIYLGAKNRIKNLKLFAKENNITADLFLSIESGINNLLGKWVITNVALVEDNVGCESFGLGPSFPVPESMVEEIINTDLGQVMNKVFPKDDERHNRGGGIELLTHNAISRIDVTESAFIMALTSIVNDFWR